MTVCQMDGVIVRRGVGSFWIETDPWCDPDLFSEALRLLGVVGRTDYEVIYDPGTGKETFIFDEYHPADPRPAVPADVLVGSGRPGADPVPEGSVWVLRDLVNMGVLQGLPGVVPGDVRGREDGQGTGA